MSILDIFSRKFTLIFLLNLVKFKTLKNSLIWNLIWIFFFWNYRQFPLIFCHKLWNLVMILPNKDIFNKKISNRQTFAEIPDIWNCKFLLLLRRWREFYKMSLKANLWLPFINEKQDEKSQRPGSHISNWFHCCKDFLYVCVCTGLIFVVIR